MTATSLDLSQIKTDALSAAPTFRSLIGLGSSATLNAGSANGVATLDANAKLTSAQIPDISLISYLGSVASQAAMLALTGQQGDWCVRSDLSTTWVITGSDPTLLANWTQLSYPSVPVQSVFGRTGAVVGVSTDYSSVGITNTAIGASNPSTGAFTTLTTTGAAYICRAYGNNVGITYFDAYLNQSRFIQYNSDGNLTNFLQTGGSSFINGGSFGIGTSSPSAKLDVAAGTVTTNVPALSITQTWNQNATTFQALKLDVTDTSSASGSLLLDLQVVGVSKFYVTKTGAWASNTGSAVYSVVNGTDGGYGFKLTSSVEGDAILIRGGTTHGVAAWNLFVQASGVLGFGTTNLNNKPEDGADIFLARDAAGTLAQRNGTSAQTYRLYNTYTSSTSFENLQLQWASNEARIGTSVGEASGTQRNLVLGSWAANGTWTAGLTVTAAAATFSGNVTVSAVNIVTDTTTGTKIGTGTTQKLGFWNATPVVQPDTSVAAATTVAGSGTAVTEDSTFDGYTLAKIVKALRNTGILA